MHEAPEYSPPAAPWRSFGKLSLSEITTSLTP